MGCGTECRRIEKRRKANLQRCRRRWGNCKVASGKWQKCLYSQQKQGHRPERRKELGGFGVVGIWPAATAATAATAAAALTPVERRPEIMYALIPHLNSTARTTH